MDTLIENVLNFGTPKNIEMTQAIKQGEQFQKYQQRIKRELQAGNERCLGQK
jgi:hypothetical protein